MSQILTPQVVTETLDGLVISSLQLPAFYALGLLPRVNRLGPTFGAAGEEGQPVAPPLDAAGLQALTLELLRQTWVELDDGRKHELTSQAKINEVFSGRFSTLLKVVGFAVKVNFEAFPDGSKSEPAALQLPAA